MKFFTCTVLSVLSLSSFAKCDILVHKSISKQTINELITYGQDNDNLKNSSFTKFSKKPNFGIKEVQKRINTGQKNIFGEEITRPSSHIYIYEAGYPIFKTQESMDYKLLMNSIADKLVELNCN